MKLNTMKTFELAAERGLALQLLICSFMFVEAQDQCYFSRLDVLPCPVRSGSLPIPQANQYAIYQTRTIMGSAGLVECRIRSFGAQVRNIVTLGSDEVMLLRSPGYPQSYSSQLLVKYNVQCPEGHLSFVNVTRMDIQPRTCSLNGELVCSDYLQIDQGQFGIMEFCGNESKFLTILPGQFNATFRTDESGVFPGFEMLVVCYQPEERNLTGCNSIQGVNGTIDVNSLFQVSGSINATFDDAAVGAAICSENACNPVLREISRVTLQIFSRINAARVEEIRQLFSENGSCLQNPTTEQPSEDPTTEQPLENPTTEQPSENPTTEQPLENPTTEQPSENPTTLLTLYTDGTTMSPTTEVPIVLIASALSGVVGVVVVVLIVIICLIALWKKRQMVKERESDYDDIGTKLSTKCQKNDTSLATPAIPLQSTSTRQATEEYEDYVNQGLGPVYYSSVKDGDYGNEYDYISDNPGSVVMMATNPAYQTTSHPNSTSGAIWDKKM